MFIFSEGKVIGFPRHRVAEIGILRKEILSMAASDQHAQVRLMLTPNVNSEQRELEELVLEKMKYS